MAVGRPNRLRATSAAAAAPNSSIIGGAGTGEGLPLDDPDPPDDPELDDEELEELDDEPPMPPVLLVLDEPFELNPSLDELIPLELG